MPLISNLYLFIPSCSASVCLLERGVSSEAWGCTATSVAPFLSDIDDSDIFIYVCNFQRAIGDSVLSI